MIAKSRCTLDREGKRLGDVASIDSTIVPMS